MTKTHQELFDIIENLPVEKLNIAIAFLNFLKQQEEEKLFTDAAEEDELHEILASGEFISSEEMLAAIKEMPDD